MPRISRKSVPLYVLLVELLLRVHLDNPLQMACTRQRQTRGNPPTPRNLENPSLSLSPHVWACRGVSGPRPQVYEYKSRQTRRRWGRATERCRPPSAQLGARGGDLNTSQLIPFPRTEDGAASQGPPPNARPSACGQGWVVGQLPVPWGHHGVRYYTIVYAVHCVYPYSPYSCLILIWKGSSKLPSLIGSVLVVAGYLASAQGMTCRYIEYEYNNSPFPRSLAVL